MGNLDWSFDATCFIRSCLVSSLDPLEQHISLAIHSSLTNTVDREMSGGSCSNVVQEKAVGVSLFIV